MLIMEPQEKEDLTVNDIFICVQNLYKRLKKIYLLGIFPFGVLELLPVLADLELLLPVKDSGKLSCNTLTEGGETEEIVSSSDLKQERIYCKLNAKCTLERSYWQKSIIIL